MCTSLSCRINENSTSCFSANGFGAADGTTCAQGKICSQGQCVGSEKASLAACPFDDDVIVNNTIISEPLPSTQMSCMELMIYLRSLGKSSIIYCDLPSFRQICCKTCLRKSIFWYFHNLKQFSLTCILNSAQCSIISFVAINHWNVRTTRKDATIRRHRLTPNLSVPCVRSRVAFVKVSCNIYSNLK